MIIAIDVGGMSAKFALFNGENEILEKWTASTLKIDSESENNQEGRSLSRFLYTEISKVLEKKNLSFRKIDGIGVALPGPVKDNRVSFCVNLSFSVENFTEELEEQTGVPVFVENDANLAALGEFQYGGHGAVKNFAMITLGTGVGGGLIVNREILSGSHACAGEIGHMVVNPAEEIPAASGNHGELEQYASATGIVRMMKEEIQNGAETVLKSREAFEAKDVIDAAKTGDPIALRVFQKAMDYLGFGIASLMVMTDPEVVVIGGGVSYAGEFLRSLVDERATAYSRFLKIKPEIKLAALGNDAGIYGAKALAERRLGLE